MRKSIVFAVIVVLVSIIGITLIAGYNGLVDMDETIDQTYSQIEIRLQERHDKIGQIVATVSGLQEHAEAIYTAITEARAAYAGAESLEDLVAADAAEAVAFTNLLVVVEDNPNITAGAGFYALIDEISSMESALSVARRDYNTAVQTYNAAVRRFPRVLYASMFGFDASYPYWKMNDGADDVPTIDFTDD